VNLKKVKRKQIDWEVAELGDNIAVPVPLLTETEVTQEIF
jgi:hypothetical protein